MYLRKFKLRQERAKFCTEDNKNLRPENRNSAYTAWVPQFNIDC